jgi:hypothetical protein
VVTLRGELDLSGAAVLQAQLTDIRWQGRLRSVADLTSLLTRFEAHDTIEHAVTGTGAPRSPVFPGLTFSLATLTTTFFGAHQRAAILPPCPASGQRRGTLYRESR